MNRSFAEKKDTDRGTGKKIGIMGGTFNPIHNGHLLIAENAREQYQLDQIYFIPTGISPHKNDNAIVSAEIRCAMIEAAIADNPHFVLSTIETDSNEPSYTYLTLERLTRMQPEDDFYFIMGGDSVAAFHTWKNPGQICALCTLLVAVRDDMDKTQLLTRSNALKREFGADIRLVNTPNFSVSSHEVRMRVQAAASIRYLVPKEIEQMIKEHQLYQAG